jgi:phospho-N-acetylmuramoyl-pentapeptide-transferase
MGDTGSLFFGALTAGSAVILKNPLILIVVCIVFVLEGISDILQVFVYKLTKKRILRMAPLHHHFEMLGFSEKSIVLLFVGISVIFAFVASLAFLPL